jgi:hypothetical protein
MLVMSLTPVPAYIAMSSGGALAGWQVGSAAEAKAAEEWTTFTRSARARVSIKELDDATRTRRLRNLLGGRQERHQEVRAAHARRRHKAAVANHPESTGARHGHREFARPDPAHRRELQGKLATDQPGEASADSHRTDLQDTDDRRSLTAVSTREG